MCLKPHSKNANLKKIYGWGRKYYKLSEKCFRMLLSSVSPVLASKYLHKRRFGRSLDLNTPTTLNEKLMWLKLNTYRDNSQVTKCADKYRVRGCVVECGCKEILNDLIGVYDDADDINWDVLPDKFVLKYNHGSGYNIICTDKHRFNYEDANNKLRQWQKEDYWKLYAEINYKHIEKKIICEKYIETDNELPPNDYKVYCINGKPELILFIRDRGRDLKRNFMSADWRRIDVSCKQFFQGEPPARPSSLTAMLYYAERLSSPFPFVRVDFYDSKGSVIFGEMTFTPVGCMAEHHNYEAVKYLGNILRLPGKYS